MTSTLAGRLLPRPIAFVLSGGASLGAVQVGQLAALDAAGVRPDLVVGTSAGALNGAVLAANPVGAAGRLDELWRQMQRRDVFPGTLLAALWRLRRSGTHAVDSAGLERLADGVLDAEVFADLELPLAVATLDLRTARLHVIDSGPLVPALLASAAIPGVFPPVEVGERMLVDGGIVANLPVAEAAERGAGTVVLLDCAVPVPETDSARAADLLRLVGLVQTRQQVEAALPAVAARCVVLALPGPRPRLVNPLDFAATGALIDESRTATEAFLGSLVVDGPGVVGDAYERYPGGWAVPRGTGLGATDAPGLSGSSA